MIPRSDWCRGHISMYGFIDMPFQSITYPAQLTGEDSYQIAIMGTQGIRVEIVTDGPPPPPEAP